MKIYSSGISKDLMKDFASDIGASEYFSYVGNMISVEKALAVIAILVPDFLEIDRCILWSSNANEYIHKKRSIRGYTKSLKGALIESKEKKDIERYLNIFPITQFFSKWEMENGDDIIQKLYLSERDYKLCWSFAVQLEKYWRLSLKENFPNKIFEFELENDLLGEYGICLTFWEQA